MPQFVAEIAVFVASPAEVARERHALDAVADEINRTVGAEEGFRLVLKKWETFARPAAGRPQGVVNAQAGAYDVFVGLLWKRFGTPTGKAGSGTEEEFERAHAAWQRRGSPPPEVLFYFSEARVRPSEVEPGQLARVQAFRRRIQADHLVWTYPHPARFADVARPHLVAAARSVMRRAARPPAETTATVFAVPVGRRRGRP
jgi:hypothetical protein